MCIRSLLPFERKYSSRFVSYLRTKVCFEVTVCTVQYRGEAAYIMYLWRYVPVLLLSSFCLLFFVDILRPSHLLRTPPPLTFNPTSATSLHSPPFHSRYLARKHYVLPAKNSSFFFSLVASYLLLVCCTYEWQCRRSRDKRKREREHRVKRTWRRVGLSLHYIIYI